MSPDIRKNWGDGSMMLVDLHTHSTASDGQYTPAELVSKAKDAGVEVLALTDHDTIAGVEEAVDAGEEVGIAVLRGVELGASEDRHMHILGLGLSEHCSCLSQLCQVLRNSRDERKYRIIDFLKEKGISIQLSEVEELAGGEVIARPHFARVLLRHGYVSSVREAFDRYLDTDEYQKIERFKADARTCIESIHRDGGKAVLAHPYQLGYSDEKLWMTLQQLKDWGLDGLECHYPRHTPEQVQTYLEIARKLQLYVSAGSDFHGEQVRPDTVLTAVPLDIHWISVKKS